MRIGSTSALLSALFLATAPAFAQNCVGDKMVEIESKLGKAQPLAVSGSLDLGGCRTPDFPKVNECAETLTERKPVILTAPEGYSLNKATVLITKTHEASTRYKIGEISYLIGEDGATRSASVLLTCTKENKLGGGGCEISIALTGTAEPFIGRDVFAAIIDDCRAEGKP